MIARSSWPEQLLLVDAGNSRLKFKLIAQAAVAELKSVCATGDTSALQSVIEKTLEAESMWLMNEDLLLSQDQLAADEEGRLAGIHAVRNQFIDRRSLVLISSVAQRSVAVSLQAWAREAQGGVEAARVVQTAMGVDMRYGNISTLGVDRWLAMIAAYQRASGAACVVDCGTAITADFLTPTGVHEGGLIAPGFETCLSSLNLADSLKDAVRAVAQNQPDVDVRTPVRRQDRLGLSSAACIFHGVERMTLAFLDTVFSQLKVDGPSHQLFITGGGWPALAYDPPVDYRYAQNLVFEGLIHTWLTGHTKPFLQQP